MQRAFPLPGAASISTVSGFILKEFGMEQKLGPSLLRKSERRLAIKTEATVAKKSAIGGDRAWRTDLHSVQTVEI